MNERLPPYPSGDLRAWAMKMYEYMTADASIRGQVEPMPVLLPHMVANRMERASVAGILLYDPQQETVVFSKQGSWHPMGGNSPTKGTMIAGFTTAERDALTAPPDGIMIYNETTAQFEGRAGGNWVPL